MDDVKRCTARISDGSRRCRKARMNGSNVCRSHGGAAPQVKRSARARLAAMANPAAAALGVAMAKALAKGDWSAAIRAATAILDRSGYGAASSVTSLDLARLSDEQLHALAAGEDPLAVLSMPPPMPEPAPAKPKLHVVPAPPPVEDDDEEVAL